MKREWLSDAVIMKKRNKLAFSRIKSEEKNRNCSQTIFCVFSLYAQLFDLLTINNFIVLLPSINNFIVFKTQ